MDLDVFLSLDIEDKIKYLNTCLSEGKTVIRIREELGIGEKKLQKILKENNYKYNQKDKRYYKDTTNKPKLDVIDNTDNVIQNEYNTNILQEYKKDFIEILEAKNDIFEVISAFKNGVYHKDTTNVIEVITATEGIHIKEFNSQARGTSVRIYDETLQKWKKFCNKNKKYSNQDLISMALEEYIDKYK